MSSNPQEDSPQQQHLTYRSVNDDPDVDHKHDGTNNDLTVGPQSALSPPRPVLREEEPEVTATTTLPQPQQQPTISNKTSEETDESPSEKKWNDDQQAALDHLNASNNDDSNDSNDTNDHESCCDACGFESAYVPEGMVQCPHCRSQQYCSPECRDWAWNQGGHDKECVTAENSMDALQLSQPNLVQLPSQLLHHSATSSSQGATASTGLRTPPQPHNNNNQNEAYMAQASSPSTSSLDVAQLNYNYSSMQSSSISSKDFFASSSSSHNSVELLPRKPKSSHGGELEATATTTTGESSMEPDATTLQNMTPHSSNAWKKNGSAHSAASMNNNVPEETTEGDDTIPDDDVHEVQEVATATVAEEPNDQEREEKEAKSFLNEDDLDDDENSLNIMEDEDADSVLHSIIEESSVSEEPDVEGSWRSRNSNILGDEGALLDADQGHDSAAAEADPLFEAETQQQQRRRVPSSTRRVPRSTQATRQKLAPTSDHTPPLGTEDRDGASSTQDVTTDTQSTEKASSSSGVNGENTIPNSNPQNYGNYHHESDGTGHSSDTETDNCPSFAIEEDGRDLAIPAALATVPPQSPTNRYHYPNVVHSPSSTQSPSRSLNDHLSSSHRSPSNSSRQSPKSLKEHFEGGLASPRSQASRKSLLDLPSVHNSESEESDDGPQPGENGGNEEFELTMSPLGRPSEGKPKVQIPESARQQSGLSGSFGQTSLGGSFGHTSLGGSGNSMMLNNSGGHLDDAQSVRSNSLANASSLKEFRQAYSRDSSFSSRGLKNFHQIYHSDANSVTEDLSVASHSRSGGSSGTSVEEQNILGSERSDDEEGHVSENNNSVMTPMSRRGSNSSQLSRSEALKMSINKALRDYETLYGADAARGAFQTLTQAFSDEKASTAPCSPVKTIPREATTPVSARSAPVTRGVPRKVSNTSFSSWALPGDSSVFSNAIPSDSSGPEAYSTLSPGMARSLKSPRTISPRARNPMLQPHQERAMESTERAGKRLKVEDNERGAPESIQIAMPVLDHGNSPTKQSLLAKQHDMSNGTLQNSSNGGIPLSHSWSSSASMSTPSRTSLSLAASSGEGDEGQRYLRYRSILAQSSVAIATAAQLLQLTSSNDMTSTTANVGTNYSADSDQLPMHLENDEEDDQARGYLAVTPDRKDRSGPISISMSAATSEYSSDDDSSARYQRYRTMLAESASPLKGSPFRSELSSPSPNHDPWAPVETPERRIRLTLSDGMSPDSPRYRQYRSSLAQRISVTPSYDEENKDDADPAELQDQLYSHLTRGAPPVQIENDDDDDSDDDDELEDRLTGYLKKSTTGSAAIANAVPQSPAGSSTRSDRPGWSKRNSWYGLGGLDFSSNPSLDVSEHDLVEVSTSDSRRKGQTMLGPDEEADHSSRSRNQENEVFQDDYEIDLEAATRPDSKPLIESAPSYDESGSDTDFQVPTKLEKDGNRGCFWFFIIACLCLVLVGAPVGIGVGIALSKDDDESKNKSGASDLDTSDPPTQSPSTLMPTFALSPSPSSQPSMPPSSVPSFVPTMAPSTSQAPSLEPTVLLLLLNTASSDNGAAIQINGSPQNQAYFWLRGTNITTMSDEQIVQRYALATLYYSTGGDEWSQKNGWLSEDDECNWFFDTLPACENGVLKTLDLGFNNLGGQLPKEVGMLRDLEVIILSGGAGNKISGELPADLRFLTQLRRFKAANNQILGSIPSNLEWPALTSLDLSRNLLRGQLPDTVGLYVSLKSLNLANNEIFGSLPASIGDLILLEDLDLSNNALEEAIPESIGNLTKLQTLKLGNNQFTWLPRTVGKLINLQTLQVPENYLMGPLFNDWQDLDFLETLDLSNNNISGPIPPTLGFLQRVQILDLSFNQFNGNIPDTLGDLQSVFRLFLNSNQLSGPIPAALSGLDVVSILRVDHNNLTGTVPEPLCDTLAGNNVPKFYLDCDPNAVQNGKVKCPLSTCCTHCCVESVGCECVFKDDLPFLC